MLAPNFVASLLTWYSANRRDLPWRHTSDGAHPDPYQVLVSEFMLQQTTVPAVIPRFEQWIRDFPTVEALASEEPETVLLKWEGLGYYSRARNLHAAAKEIVKSYGGRVPDEPRELRRLPGVGEYTAAAAASIAYGVRVPALDANNIRVWSRLLATSDRKKVQAVFGRIIPPDRPGDFNQALMDLGASVCTPKDPACDSCPLSCRCRAFRLKEVERFPARKKPSGVTALEVALGVVFHREKILVQKRGDKGLFAGMWEFPGGKLRSTEGAGRRAQEKIKTATETGQLESPEEAVVREVLEETGLRVRVREKLGVFTHSYTRFRVKLHVFICRKKAGRPTNPEARWVTLDELEALPMPSANRRIVKALESAMKRGMGETVKRGEAKNPYQRKGVSV